VDGQLGEAVIGDFVTMMHATFTLLDTWHREWVSMHSKR